MIISADAIERAQKIELVIFDVDGVLTDGKIYIGNDGELFKAFNCHDGFGITNAQKAGLKTAIITGRNSPCTTNRARELKINSVKQGQMNKRGAYKELKSEFNLTDEQIAYVADDVIDLPVFVQVGFRAAVADAAAEVKERAHFIADNIGGNGAVRDVLEFILKVQGKWDKIISQYTAVEDDGGDYNLMQ